MGNLKLLLHHLEKIDCPLGLGIILFALILRLSLIEDIPFINDEPKLLAKALECNALSQWADLGLRGTQGVIYGPAPVWIYQLLLRTSHDLYTLGILKALFDSALLFIGLRQLQRVLKFSWGVISLAFVSPFLWFYARHLWDNSFNIGFSLLLVSNYLAWIYEKRPHQLLLASLSGAAVFLTHLMGLPLLLGVVLHALLFERNLLKKKEWAWVLIALLIFVSISWDYMVFVAGQAEGIPSVYAFRGLLFPWKGGIFFSSAGMDYFFDGKLASLLQGGWRRIWLALDFFGRTGVLLAGAGLCAALGVAVGPSPGSLPRHRSTARLAILTLLIGSLAYFKQGGFGHPHYLNGIWPAHLLALVVLLEIPKLKPVTLPLLWLQALCLLGFILLTQQGIHERGGTRGIHYGVSLRQQIEIVRQTAGAESAETDIEQFRSFGHSLSTIQMLGMAGQREKVQGRFFVGFRETGDPSDAHVEIRRIDSR